MGATGGWPLSSTGDFVERRQLSAVQLSGSIVYMLITIHRYHSRPPPWRLHELGLSLHDGLRADKRAILILIVENDELLSEK